MRAYKVYGFKINRFTNWSGTVIGENKESVENAIRNKFGILEIEGQDINYKEIPFESVSISELTIGEYCKLMKGLGVKLL